MELFNTKLTVLVVRIVINDNVFFLSLNPTTLSLSSTKKRTKKEKNKVLYQNVMFINYMDRLPNRLKG